MLPEIAPTLIPTTFRTAPAQSANTASLSSRNPHFEDLEMFSEPWKMLKETVLSFIDDEALSRGAAIAFYTVTSIAPVLLGMWLELGLARSPVT